MREVLEFIRHQKQEWRDSAKAFRNEEAQLARGEIRGAYNRPMSPEYADRKMRTCRLSALGSDQMAVRFEAVERHLERLLPANATAPR